MSACRKGLDVGRPQGRFLKVGIISGMTFIVDFL
jgi:hypothetical protein